MEELSVVQRLVIIALPLVLAITLHEAAHGLVAYWLGDRTAFMLGRVSANPIKHIDPIGTLLLPTLMYLFTSFIFGWAKPVPVNTKHLRNPKRDMAIVALAGPLSNLLQAILWSLVILAALSFVRESPYFGEPLMLMGVAGVIINAFIMVLNLMPIPPLDGGRILVGILPLKAARVVASLEPYGLFILIGLLLLGVLGLVVMPAVFGLIYLLPGTEVVAAFAQVIFNPQ